MDLLPGKANLLQVPVHLVQVVDKESDCLHRDLGWRGSPAEWEEWLGPVAANLDRRFELEDTKKARVEDLVDKPVEDLVDRP